MNANKKACAESAISAQAHIDNSGNSQYKDHITISAASAKSNLKSQDYANLAQSWVSAEIADRAGLYRVDSVTGAEIVGRKFKPSQDLSGLVFPNIWPGESNARSARLRRFNPDLELQPDGTVKEKAKYLSPPGRANILYIPPGTDPAWLESVSITVVIVEGEKKALAMNRYYWERGMHVLVIAVTGVWSWRGQVGIDRDANGHGRPVKGVIPDFDRIEWAGRRVLILFDANAATNKSVAAARRGLAKMLIAHGANVEIIELPTGINGANGIDDLLAVKGPEFVTNLLTASKPAEAPPDTSKKRTQAAKLIHLAQQSAEFFNDGVGRLYASVQVKNHCENIEIESSKFKRWLTSVYFITTTSTVGDGALSEALRVIEHLAEEGQQCEVNIRVAQHHGKIYLDLCDEEWRVIEIDRDGWRVIKESPVKFRRTKAMRPLPEPTCGGSIGELRKLLNINDDGWVLTCGFLISLFRTDFPYPILILSGEQGSAKSSFMGILRGLIDPNISPLRSLPRDERDFMISAHCSYLLAFDNVSFLHNWTSDLLCRLTSGAGFATRTLYEDSEETVFNARRAIVINGIEDFATRGDLLDRSLIIPLQKLHKTSTAKRREEAELRVMVEAMRPGVLGALCEIAASALRELPNTHIEDLPRMADFAVWATAAEEGFGFEKGQFLKVYAENNGQSSAFVRECSPLTSMLELLISDQDWKGSATELLTELNRKSGYETGSKKPVWLLHANALSGQLSRLAPSLRESGIEIEKTRTKIGSLISITKTAPRIDEQQQAREEITI